MADINTYALGIQFNLSASKALDTLKDVSQKATDIYKQFDKAIKVNIESGGISQFNEQAKQINTQSDEYKQKVDNYTRSIGNFIEAVRESAGDQDKQREIYVKHGNEVQRLTERLGRLTKSGQIYSLEAQQIQQALEDAGPAIRQFGLDVTDAEEATRKNKIEMASHQAVINGWKNQIIQMISDIGPFGKILSTIGNVFKSQGVDVSKGSKSLEGFSDTSNELLDVSGKSIKGLKDTTNVFKGLGIGSTGAAKGIGAATAGMDGSAAAAGPAGIALIAVKVAWEGIKTAANAAGDALTKMGMANSAAGASVVEGIKTLNVFKMATSFLTAGIAELVKIEDDLRTVTYRAMGTTEETSDAVRVLQKDLNLTGEEAIEFTKAMVDAGAVLVANRSELEKISKVTSMFSKATGVSASTTAKFVVTMKSEGRTVADVERQLGRFTTAMKSMGMSAEEAASILEKLISMKPQLDALFGTGKVEEYGDALLALTEEFKSLGGPGAAPMAISLMDKLHDTFSATSAVSGALGKNLNSPIDRLRALQERVDVMGGSWESMHQGKKQAIADAFGLSTAEFNLFRRMSQEAGGIDNLMKKYEEKMKQMKADQALNEKYQESIGTLGEWMKRLFVDIMPGLTDELEKWKPAIKEAMESLKPFVGEFIKGIPKYLPMIIGGFKTIIGIFKWMMPIAEAVAGLVVGWMESWFFLFGPIWDSLTAVGGVLVDLAVRLGILKEKGASVFEIFKVIGNIVFFAFNILTATIWLPISLLSRLFNWIFRVKKAMFSSSFLHIAEGVEFIMAPLTWLKDAFVWVWEKVTSLAGAIGGLFSDIIPTGVSIAKKALNVLLAPFKAIGDAASWVWGKLFGSGLFHIVEGVRDASSSLHNLDSEFGKIGVTAGKSGAAIEKTFGGNKFQESIIKDWSSYGKIERDAASVMMGMTPDAIDKIVHGDAAPAISGFYNQNAPTTPIRREAEKQMSTKTDESKKLDDVVLRLDRLYWELREIAGLLPSNATPKAIKELLEQFLPKIADKPAELGPAVSMW